MSQAWWIRGGRVVDPANQRDGIGDLFVEDGVMVQTLSPGAKANAKVVEAAGMLVCPGLVDIHTHLREPGDRAKETIRSGTLAAAAGGYTSVVCMPNTKPPADNVGTIQRIRDAATRSAAVRVYPMGCLTVNREGRRLAPIGSLARAGVVAVSDGGHCVQNSEVMRRACEYATMFNLPIIDHCEDASLTEGCQMHEGEWSLRLGLRGMPRAAEDIMVARDALLAEQIGAHLHLQHLASASALDIIRWAKSRGTTITAEVTPHHLSLSHAYLAGYETSYKVVPPLRTERDREALVAALLDGTLDCIATAHAPHTMMEKDREFDYAPFGINGLETAFSVCYQTLVASGQASLSQLIGWMSTRPAEILHLPGGNLAPDQPADLTLIDLDASWVLERASMQSLSFNSPWLGKTLQGKVRLTLVGGEQRFPQTSAPDEP